MTDISEQPLLINLQANVPLQVPTMGHGKGVQLINQNGFALSLCSDENFTVPVLLDVGVSMPWTTGTTVWVKSPENGTLLVLSDPASYYNPNITVASDVSSLLLPATSNNTWIGGPTYYTLTNVPITNTVRTLILQIAPPSTFLGISVIGHQTGIAYYGEVGIANPTLPYLYDSFVGYRVIVPVFPAMDTSYDIYVFSSSNVSGPSVLTVGSDPQTLYETSFYNGQPLSIKPLVTAAGVYPIIEGPARLLTLSLRTTATSASVYMSGTTFELAQATGSTDQIISFPANLTIPINQIMEVTQIGTGATVAMLNYAYP